MPNIFPESQFRNRHMTSVQINYLEETLLDDTIELMKTPGDDLANEYFIGGVSRAKGSMAFHATIQWK